MYFPLVPLGFSGVPFCFQKSFSGVPENWGISVFSAGVSRFSRKHRGFARSRYHRRLFACRGAILCRHHAPHHARLLRDGWESSTPIHAPVIRVRRFLGTSVDADTFKEGNKLWTSNGRGMSRRMPMAIWRGESHGGGDEEGEKDR